MLADLVEICQRDSHTFGLFVMYNYFDTFRPWFFASLTFLFFCYFFLIPSFSFFYVNKCCPGTEFFSFLTQCRFTSKFYLNQKCTNVGQVGKTKCISIPSPVVSRNTMMIKLLLFSSKTFSVRFTIRDSKPTLIGSKYALFFYFLLSPIHPSPIWCKTYLASVEKVI
jgi:hypothetical protein